MRYLLNYILFSFISFSLIGQEFTVDIASGCAPLTVQFNDNTSSLSWEWDFGDGSPHNTTTGTPIHTFVDSGFFNISLTVPNGANDTTYIIEKMIRVNALPEVYFDTTTVFYASFSVILRDTSNVFSYPATYIWDFDDTSPSDTVKNVLHKYLNEGTYSVKHIVVNADGCIDSLMKNITISHKYKLPNVFTPNGDNVNDQFIVESNGLDIFPEAVFYNRWGNIVYKVNNVSQVVWDGHTFDGSIVSAGTYFYVITKPLITNYPYPDNKLKGVVEVLYDRKSLK